jgi:hypothetical protein
MEKLSHSPGTKSPTYVTCHTCKYEFAGYCNFRVFMGLGDRIKINLWLIMTYEDCNCYKLKDSLRLDNIKGKVK